MPQIEPMANAMAPNDSWHLSDAERDLTGMAVADEDWQAVRVSEDDLAVMAPTSEEVLNMTDADWTRLGLVQSVLIRLRDDLMRRLGVCAQDLTWLSHAIERGQHGHTRSQTGTD